MKDCAIWYSLSHYDIYHKYTIEMHKNYPLYEATIENSTEGIYTISLVDMPAVESDFFYFKKEEKTLNFRVENEEKRLISGVIMRADHPIYRISPNGQEYFIQFSKETIEKMAEKMLLDHSHNNINLQHNPQNYVENVNLREIFIKNTAKGINPKGFETIEEGSLFATYKVNDDNVWQSIKDGEFKGFSLEGCFSSYEVEMESEAQLLEDILGLLKEIENKNK